MSIKILHPSIDSVAGQTVLRGIVARDSLSELRTDFYQREKLSRSARRDILEAFETNTQLPDIELGMRGDNFALSDDSSELELLDPIFIIDGLQRVSTLLEWLARTPDTNARLGAIIHIKTSVDWERNRFQILNSSRTRVSPNILLRNSKEDSPGIAALYGLLATDTGFCLHNRVCWRQSFGRADLITASTFVSASALIHSHLAPISHASGVAALVASVDKIISRVGLPQFRSNVQTFWSTIDQMWDIKNHHTTIGLPHLRRVFLRVFAEVLTNHVDFWIQPRELRLTFPYELKNKLTKFPIYDPEVVRLASASGKAHEALYFLFISHINSGKRTKRLVPRNARAQIVIYDTPDDDDEESVA